MLRTHKILLGKKILIICPEKDYEVLKHKAESIGAKV